jgi:uncharacterized protein (TIGR03086 family)
VSDFGKTAAAPTASLTAHEPACRDDRRGRVDASQLGRPTPCSEWDTRALLNHLILWTAHSLEARAHGGSVSPELIERDFAAGPGFAAAYRAQLDRALAAWSGPAVWQGPLDVMGTATPAADVAALNLAELVLHGWDLAAATGQRYSVSDRAAGAALTAVSANADLFRPDPALSW